MCLLSKCNLGGFVVVVFYIFKRLKNNLKNMKVHIIIRNSNFNVHKMLSCSHDHSFMYRLWSQCGSSSRGHMACKALINYPPDCDR